MHKDFRIKLLLLALLLVFLIALYMIVQIPEPTPAPDSPQGASSEIDPTVYEKRDTLPQQIDAVLSGTIIEKEGSQITVQEKKTIVTPGPTPELDTRIESENTVTATLTETTQYQGVSKEDLVIGTKIGVGVKELSRDSLEYEVLYIEKAKDTAVEMMSMPVERGE